VVQPERIDDLRARLSGSIRERLVTLLGATFDCEDDLFLGLGVLCAIVQQLGSRLPAADRVFLARYMTLICDELGEQRPQRLQ
jgi:hypothetical protein